MNEAERRREQANKLGVAIEEFLRSPGMEFKSEAMLGDWVVIGTNIYVDEEEDPNGQYFVALSNGSQLQHVTLGLLTKALQMCQSGELREE